MGLFFRPNSTLSKRWPLPLTWPRCPRPCRAGAGPRLSPAALGEASGEGTPTGRLVKTLRAQEAPAAPRTQGAPAAMQDGNFLLSALQPEAGVCSLALPSDLQLDRRGAPGPEAERLRAARVQEQVRARLLQLGQQGCHNGAAEPEGAPEAPRGKRTPGVGTGRWARPRGAAAGVAARGPEAAGLAPGLSALTHRGLALSHRPAPPGVGAALGAASQQRGPRAPRQARPERRRHMAGPPGLAASQPGTRASGPRSAALTRPQRRDTHVHPRGRGHPDTQTREAHRPGRGRVRDTWTRDTWT